MDSPMQKWLDSKQMTQSSFAKQSKVDRSDVNRVITGQRNIPAKLRAFMERVAPDVLADHEEWMQLVDAADMAKLEAA